MSISVSCSDCGKGYKVDDRFAGKKAKCKACGGALNIPAAVVASAAAAAPPAAAKGVRSTGNAARPPARSSGQKPAKPAVEADPFSSDLDLSSLAALESTGTVDQSAYEPVTAAEARRRKDELLPMSPATAAPGNRGTSYAEALANRGGKGKLMAKATNPLDAEPFSLKSLQPRGFLGWLWASVLVVGLVGLASQTLATYAAIGVGFIAICFFGYGLILPGILARREDLTVYLMYRYVPLYQLYFIISRWEETRRCVLSLIQGTLLMVIGGMLVVRAGPLSILRVFYHPDPSQTDGSLADGSHRGPRQATADSASDPDADAPVPEAGTPKGVAVKFMVAMETGDIEALRALSFNADPEVLTASAALAVAGRELEELLANKFANGPPPNPMLPKTPGQIAETAAKQLQRVSERIENDTATLPIPNKPMKFQQADGVWRVDGSSVFGELTPEKAKFVTLGAEIGTRVRKDLISEVSRGQYPTYAAVQQAIKEKTEAAQEENEEYKNAKKAISIGGLKGS